MAVNEAEIIKARKTVGNANETKNEMAMLMAPYSNWEEFLLPAPLAVSMLGTLMGLSTESDFSLEDSAPDGGFKCLNNSKSFRGCLVQVANSGWKAFNLAQTNMDQIRLLSGQVPGHLKTAMEVLFRGSQEDIEDMLPTELEKINETAEKGYSLSSAVENEFQHVIDVIDELQVASVVSKGSHEENLKANNARMEAMKNRQKELEERKTAQKKQCEEDKKRLLEVEETFNKCCDEMPSGMTMFGMQLVETAVNQVGNMLPFGRLVRLATSSIGGITDAVLATAAFQFGQDDLPATEHIKEAAKQSSSELPGISDLVGKLKLLYSTQNQAGDTIQEQKNRKKEVTTLMEFMKAKQTSDTNAKEQEVIEEFLKICQGITKSEDMPAEEQEAFVARIDKIDALVKALVFKGTQNGQSLPQPPPQASAKLSKASASESAIDSARFKVECAKENLKDTRESYEKKLDNFDKTSKLLMETMEELSSLNLKEINYKKIKEVLSKGIVVLAELKEQWGKVVQFFQMISNIIKCCLDTTVKNFVEHAEKGRARMLVHGDGPAYTLSDCRKDTIYKKAFEAAKVAYLVNMISNTYVEVSKTHIMDKIAGLTKILAYDCETEGHLINKVRCKLKDDCIAAQEEIRQLVLREKKQFDKQIDGRLKTIEEAYGKALPPPSKAAIATMEKAIKMAKDDDDLDGFL